MGKVYENRTFTASYIQLVKDLIKIFGYSKCKDYFGCFMGTDINGFSDSKKSKNTIVDLGQSVYLSTYSSTEIKKNHLIGLLGDLGINIDFISLNSGSYTPACGVVDWPSVGVDCAVLGACCVGGSPQAICDGVLQ